jgi:DNA-binding HxlR family transcriptional regulator
MRVVWELQDRALSFLELQRACDGMSSSTLTVRLRELVEAQLVEHRGDGTYALTALGAALPSAFGPLILWAEQWAEATAGPDAETDDA